MNKIENQLDYGQSLVYGSNFFSGDYNQTLVLRRSKEGSINRPQFYLCVISCINGKQVQQGYIYFYLDYQTKTSDFIGVKVNPEYRNLNIASFLIASWIDMCMNSGYEALGCVQKQRKPFPLYLLKKYSFEILNLSLYDTKPYVVSICKSNDESDRTKFLLFKSPEYEKLFINSSVSSSDNYSIIHDLDEGKTVLDRVLLPIGGKSPLDGIYRLSEENIFDAEQLSQTTIHRHTR